MKARFKPKFNIKKGDMVIVISGEAKPKKDDSGKWEYKPKTVKKVLVDESKVVVEGVNMVTKHTKPSARNTKGGIIKKEAPIHISNVMLWDAKSKAPVKVKRERENGKTVRISKKSGEKI
ncbi:MAG: 50S ribosomal protein L24 [Bacteroidetes bacterium]|jgi:large subunit ribosomal protein L24|nr:MAG: 50S ribosomal protein L24 [Bacteroidota bacterium]